MELNAMSQLYYGLDRSFWLFEKLDFIRVYVSKHENSADIFEKKRWARYLSLLDPTTWYNSVSRLRERFRITFYGLSRVPRAVPWASRRPNWINKSLGGSRAVDDCMTGIGKISARFSAHVWARGQTDYRFSSRWISASLVRRYRIMVSSF